MNLYVISQDVNNDYDTYDSAVVCAETPKEARLIHPSGGNDWDGGNCEFYTWCNAKNVKVELIGVAKKGIKKGVVIASFNAG